MPTKKRRLNVNNLNDLTTLSEDDLTKMTGPELVDLHNTLAVALGDSAVKRFATKPDAIRRVWAKVQALKEKQQEEVPAPAPEPEKVEPKKTKAGSKATELKSQSTKAELKAHHTPSTSPRPQRGTNIKPTGKPVQPCLVGSKQSILVDTLSRPEGATMAELIEALSGGRKPWTEPTVRSGFGWDLKHKGYGVRSSFGPDDIERFHLVVPEGHKLPKHITRIEARKLKEEV
jgi:hypothetical protein